MKDQSVWGANVELPELPRLEQDARCDVCVVGAGIAGLATAYRLAAEGRDVIVLDRGGVAAGETWNTTAHLASYQDDRLHRLADRHGEEVTRKVVESHAAAIDWIERTCAEESIECRFGRVPGYLFLGPEDETSTLDRELEAARRAGLRVERLAEAPGFDGGPCLSFAQQAEIDPLLFLRGLASAFQRSGGRLYGRTHVVNVEEGDACRVETAHGPTVTADSVLLATNSPANRYVVTMKMVPYRTFVVALRLTGELPRALWWDTADPYHYVRIADDPQGRVLVVGGEDHRTGTRDDGEARFQRLEAWARARFPVGELAYRWSGQVLEPSDDLAFIGRGRPGSRVHICTGDSGQGMTHGVICALLVGDLVLGRTNPWEEVYSPSRLTAKAAGDYVVDAVTTGSRWLEWLLPGEVRSENEIPRGHGAVVRMGRKLLAVHRDPEGRLHRRSAVCTHAGCIVHWNSTATIWECPCHGSRFDPLGRMMDGPATADLAEAGENPDEAGAAAD